MSRRRPDDSSDPYRQALGLLVRREHSRHELRRKLASRGTAASDADAVLDALAERGYQDDGRFAGMLVRTRVSSGHGPLHIRAELAMHGIVADVIAQALEEAQADWPALATAALRRRYGTTPARDRADIARRGAFLQRRGFDLDSIRTALGAPDED